MRIPVVSQDQLIPEMLSNHKVVIVISSGGLTALVGLAESTDVDLEILIKIKMTPREINQVYYNTAFKSMALKMNMCINISNVENKDGELQHSSHNLEYSLWNIDDISILIRCKSDGYRDSDQKIRTVGIKSKLDYQLDYNYESISFIEQSCCTCKTVIHTTLICLNIHLQDEIKKKASLSNPLHNSNYGKSLFLPDTQSDFENVEQMQYESFEREEVYQADSELESNINQEDC
ncbi:hypothetical protein C1646_767032 [Rhizophagus diaphanus]|nr:hypothetical protein C1646_767032 [Rhizophagus diaphanus] [Rhizophagus sp. MUCL 43196]